MKKIRKVFITFILMFLLSIPTMTAIAADENVSAVLISVEHIDNQDGTYSIEKVYTNHQPSYYADKMYGTDTFTKVKEVHTGASDKTPLITSFEIKGTFDWNTSTKKVKVYNVKGKVTYVSGTAKNEKTSTSGNGTTKATGKFTFDRTYKSIDGTKTDSYSVSISCDYKGKNS